MSSAHVAAGAAIEILYDYMIDILSKRVPIENVPVRIDHIISKVRLVPVPAGVIFENTHETVTVEKDGK